MLRLKKIHIVQSAILSVLDYGNIVYLHASPSTLSVYHNAMASSQVIHFSHRIAPYIRRWDGPFLTNRRRQQCMLLMLKAMMQKLPSCFSSLVEFKSCQ